MKTSRKKFLVVMTEATLLTTGMYLVILLYHFLGHPILFGLIKIFATIAGATGLLSSFLLWKKRGLDSKFWTWVKIITLVFYWAISIITTLLFFNAQ